LRRRSRASSKPVKPRRRKTVKLKRSHTSKAVRHSSAADLHKQVALLTRERDDALEQQTATSEVLQVISNSPGELEPVFATMLANAIRICDANFGNIFRWDGDVLRLIATHNTPPAFAEVRRRLPLRTTAENLIGRMVATKTVVHVADLAAEQAYIDQRSPQYVAAVELGGVRTFLAVPMLKENELVGAFILYREVVRPFTDKQTALVTSFANQAVIAIENTRLLNELRESLEQQTAAADVLHVISGSQGDLKPVFESILANGVRICGAEFGNLALVEGEGMRRTASYNPPPAFAKPRQGNPLIPLQQSPLGRLNKTKRTVNITDMAADPIYADSPLCKLAAARAVLCVPMLKEDTLIGALVLYRLEPVAFGDKQIELLTNFAAQAVIAIENARLLKELRVRTEEVEKLNQHLEQRVADQVGEIERMGKLRRFLPPQVADLIVASGTEKQLESHRREIAALFCDLRGFTGFSESSDPEDVMALLRDYHAAIGEIIIKYSGTLERYAGDGVMVVFNDPVPVDNPALQAVLMALEMRAGIGALTEKWRRLGHDIGFGIGIAHGFATLGTIGFEGRFDYAAIGTVSNVASRLCDEAKPGQILISPRVLMAVEDTVTVEAVGEFDLKGIRRPLAAYNVLATNPAN
jgi:adenylate cyclase